MTNLEINY